MSVLERVRKSQEPSGRPDGVLTSPEASSIREDEPAVIVRLRIVMSRLAEFARNGKDSKYARYTWVMEAMFDEILDEFGDNDEAMLATWFAQFGEIIAWCGSGDESRLPDAVRPYLVQKMQERQQLAITAGPSE